MKKVNVVELCNTTGTRPRGTKWHGYLTVTVYIDKKNPPGHSTNESEKIDIIVNQMLARIYYCIHTRLQQRLWTRKGCYRRSEERAHKANLFRMCAFEGERSKLIQKLNTINKWRSRQIYGVAGEELRWFQSYFSNRKQSVR